VAESFFWETAFSKKPMPAGVCSEIMKKVIRILNGYKPLKFFISLDEYKQKGFAS
jgi:hypothetical protein